MSHCCLQEVVLSFVVYTPITPMFNKAVMVALCACHQLMFLFKSLLINFIFNKKISICFDVDAFSMLSVCCFEFIFETLCICL